METEAKAERLGGGATPRSPGLGGARMPGIATSDAQHGSGRAWSGPSETSSRTGGTSDGQRESPVFVCRADRKPRSGSPSCVSPWRRLTGRSPRKADQPSSSVTRFLARCMTARAEIALNSKTIVTYLYEDLIRVGSGQGGRESAQARGQLRDRPARLRRPVRHLGAGADRGRRAAMADARLDGRPCPVAGGAHQPGHGGGRAAHGGHPHHLGPRGRPDGKATL